MAYSHTITFAVEPGINGLSHAKSYSASADRNFSETIAVGTDTLVSNPIDVSAVKSYYIVSDRVVTIETNSGSAADDTIVLKAGVPYVWNTDSYDAFLLGTDVTGFYITNASGGSAVVEQRCVLDATP
jgi:hypothetical protein